MGIVHFRISNKLFCSFINTIDNEISIRKDHIIINSLNKIVRIIVHEKLMKYFSTFLFLMFSPTVVQRVRGLKAA